MIGASRVFLDASVLIAASASVSGGSSAAIGLLAGSDSYQAAVSRQVLRESVLNVREKFERAVFARLYSLLADLQPELVEPSLTPATDIPVEVAAKDHHVLQACLSGGASTCLTLDRRHLLNAQARRWAISHGFRLLTPGEFLEWHRATGL